MSALDSEDSSPAGARETANPLLNRVPPTSSPLRRALTQIAVMAGGALLIASSILHLLLWSEVYRETAPIGPLFAFQGILGALLAFAVVRFAHLGTVLAAAFYLAVSTAALVLISDSGLLGYRQSLSEPYGGLAVNVSVAGFVLLAAAAWMILSSEPAPRSPAGPAAQTSPQGDEGPLQPDEQILQPATLVPRPDPRTAEPIRWPADRPHRVILANLPLPEPQRGQPVEEPATTQKAEPELKAADEPASRPDEPDKEPAAEAAGEPPGQVEEPAAEAAGEPPERIEGSPELPTAPEPVPEWFPEPIRSMLVRELEVLSSLERALGRDDPSVLNARGNIAYYYFSAGDVARAYALQKDIAADSARILGEDHPYTVTATRKLGQWRRLAKKRRRSKVTVGG